MTMDIAKIQATLDTMREAFVDEIPDRSQEIENLVLEMAAGNGSVFDELFRSVHSFKGVSATHGMGQVSLVCHYFEDVLTSSAVDHLAGITEKLATSLLRYVDVMRNIHAVMAEGDGDFSDIEKELAALRVADFGQKRLALIVESSPVIAAICKQALERLNIKAIVMDDGMLALHRLLVDRFDILLVGKQIKSLNGGAVVCALRASDGRHKNVFAITLSSQADAGFGCNDANSCFVRKDGQLADQLEAVLSDKFAAA